MCRQPVPSGIQPRFRFRFVHFCASVASPVPYPATRKALPGRSARSRSIRSFRTRPHPATRVRRRRRADSAKYFVLNEKIHVTRIRHLSVSPCGPGPSLRQKPLGQTTENDGLPRSDPPTASHDGPVSTVSATPAPAMRAWRPDRRAYAPIAAASRPSLCPAPAAIRTNVPGSGRASRRRERPRFRIERRR